MLFNLTVVTIYLWLQSVLPVSFFPMSNTASLPPMTHFLKHYILFNFGVADFVSLLTLGIVINDYSVSVTVCVCVCVHEVS